MPPRGIPLIASLFTINRRGWDTAPPSRSSWRLPSPSRLYVHGAARPGSRRLLAASPRPVRGGGPDPLPVSRSCRQHKCPPRSGIYFALLEYYATLCGGWFVSATGQDLGFSAMRAAGQEQDIWKLPPWTKPLRNPLQYMICALHLFLESVPSLANYS